MNKLVNQNLTLMKKIIYTLILISLTLLLKAQVVPSTGLVLGNYPSGGSIGIAANTVDKSAKININQTTPGQTLSIPNPTNLTAEKNIRIRNIGLVAFTITAYGSVLPGTFIQVDWTGSSYSYSSSSSADLTAYVQKRTGNVKFDFTGGSNSLELSSDNGGYAESWYSIAPGSNAFAYGSTSAVILDGTTCTIGITDKLTVLADEGISLSTNPAGYAAKIKSDSLTSFRDFQHPDTSGMYLLRSNIDTISNKIISGATNTFSNISQSSVINLVSNLSAKQNLLNGTGFVKSTAGIISYDNSNYLTVTGSAAGLTSFPILNQNTTGNSSNITATTNNTLISLPSLILPGSQLSGNIAGNSANVTATTNNTLISLPSLILPGSQLSGNIAGNSATASAFETPRTINGITFTGTSNISIPSFGIASPIIATDLSFTATSNNAYHLPTVLSSNKTITIPTGNEGEFLEFYNNETGFVWNISGLVYFSDNTTLLTSLLANTNYMIRKVNGRWRILN